MASLHSQQSEERERTFTPQEVEALVQEVHALQAEERERIPYSRVREMLGELGIPAERLDQAVRSLDARRHTGQRPSLLRPRMVFGAGVGAALLAATLTLFGVRHARSEMQAATPVMTAAPRAVNLHALEGSGSLYVEGRDLVFHVHNPLDRALQSITLRVNGYRNGIPLEQLYEFRPAGGLLEPGTSMQLRAPSGDGTLRDLTWKVEAVIWR